MTDPVLRIRGLHVGFPTDTGIVRAVDGVDLDVLAGECLGVVGESGSGKTVTFLATLGLVAPPGVVTAETISWKGRDLLKLRAAEMRAVRGREIALTMQDALTALNPVLSIGTQIDETLAAHGAYRSSTDRRARAVELLQLVGIPEPARRLRAYPYELSGGMRQRAMIAVALACGPELVKLDPDAFGRPAAGNVEDMGRQAGQIILRRQRQGSGDASLPRWRRVGHWAGPRMQV